MCRSVSFKVKFKKGIKIIFLKIILFVLKNNTDVSEVITEGSVEKKIYCII